MHVSDTFFKIHIHNSCLPSKVSAQRLHIFKYHQWIIIVLLMNTGTCGNKDKGYAIQKLNPPKHY